MENDEIQSDLIGVEETEQSKYYKYRRWFSSCVGSNRTLGFFVEKSKENKRQREHIT